MYRKVHVFFSYISGISLLGLPAEMYTYGTQFWMNIVPEVFVAMVMAYAILPVFYNLQITSTYEVRNYLPVSNDGLSQIK